MIENRIFFYALLISIFVHAGLIVRLSISPVGRLPKDLKKVEITYNPAVSAPKQEPSPPRPSKSIEEQKLGQEPEILVKRETIPQAMINKVSKPLRRLELHDKDDYRMDQILKSQGKVSVSSFTAQKINNPLYINYNERVRNKIKEYVVMNYTRSDVGEVYLTFVLSSDGKLQQIKLMKNRTRASEYLQNIGLESIREASPFAPFPADLPYPELTFNIAISFKIRK